MFTKNPFNKKDEVADLIGNILEADYKVKKEELKGNQHKIDMNKNNKIDAQDFKMLRTKGGTQKDEEIDPNKMTTDTLRGRNVGKGANPFLTQKVFMDVPGNVKEEAEQIDEATSIVGNPKISGPTKGATPYGDSFKSISTHHVIGGKKYTVTTDHDHDGGHFHEIHSGKKLLHQSYTNEYGEKDPTPHKDPSLDSATKRKLSADHNKIAKLHHPDRDDLDEEVELDEEPSHQARTTMKHIKNPTPGEKKAAKDIKPGIAGYRDRVAMLRSAEAGGRLTKEEIEQIDELKKSTLMRYASKATKSAIGLGVKAARARDEDDMATWAKNRNKAEKRDRNVQKAIGKMRSEEVEQIDERELTKGETKEKERIVKGMKKSLSGFKQRYGDRAKSVMYATATKTAKKD